MSDEWIQGWQEGFDFSYANSVFTVRYTEINNEKIYTGSYSVKYTKPIREDFRHRGSNFDRGYGEGLISGSGKRWDDTRDDILLKLGIKMSEEIRYIINANK